MICAIVYHPDYLRHKTGVGHPESPDRLTAIMRRLDESGLLKKLILIEPNPAKEEDILLVHSKRHFETIKNASEGIYCKLFHIELNYKSWSDLKKL
ncbi:MAG: hypothetical protein Q8P28_11370 [Deltaproteobacteria bacterium]|nr:hypothetical protein [Deltaproteobacteria bacterium]